MFIPGFRSYANNILSVQCNHLRMKSMLRLHGVVSLLPTCYACFVFVMDKTVIIKVSWNSC